MNEFAQSPAQRKTGRRVRFFDHAARMIISTGGLMVLAAMCGIMVFLVLVAAPLFRGAAVLGQGPGGHIDLPEALAEVRVLNGTDHAFLITADGVFLDLSMSQGVVRTRLDMAEDWTVTAFAFETGRWRVTLGTEDGHVLTRQVNERWHLVPPDADVPNVSPGAAFPLTDEAERIRIAAVLGLTETLPPSSFLEADAEGAVVLWEPIVEETSDFRIPDGEGAVVRVASSGVGVRSRFIAAVRADRTVTFGQVRSTVRLDGGGATERLVPYSIQLPEDFSIPDHLFVLADGSALVCIWKDGRFLRYDTRSPRDGIVIAEQGRLLDSGRSVTAAAMALGAHTLIIGDDSGSLSTYLMVADAGSDTTDSRILRRVWSVQAGKGAVLNLAPGDRDRTVSVSTADDLVSVFHLTSHKRLISRTMTQNLKMAVASPSTDQVLALSEGGEYQSVMVDPGYPEVSAESLFGKVHYEGYAKPDYVYQSTGDAQSEPKYSLVPLLFGTIKATIFAMLFALPLAVAAAIYTSEFMHRKVHRVVKPAIELMASLPSVVIGFVAAIFVAPLVRDWLPAIMVGMLIVPLIAVFVGTLWQMIPPRYARRLGSRVQLLGAVLIFISAIGLSSLVGPTVERTMFAPSHDARLVEAGYFEPLDDDATNAAVFEFESMSAAQRAKLRRNGVFMVGNQPVRPVETQEPLQAASGSIERWLDGNYGQPFPGWLIAMMFPSALLVPVLIERVTARPWNAWLDSHSRVAAAIAEIVRFAFGLIAIVVVALGMAWALSAMGFDPRDSIFGRFTPRNTLVVGIVMGLAVIPIIFTISEDALASVPNTLRSASLGTGATRWQTALRVVLPVAASGIFSAIMIGLGRAVGETMIVLMATGNTPEMNWNIFAGFRTLAANIAVELPEAPRGDAHYRVLFLCGLVLFLLTLIINTLAEVVRQHFRKKSAAL